MKSRKTVIVIPVFNGEKFISRSLNSCVNQTIAVETWILDNCSTDTTPLIVNSYAQKYPQVKLIKNEINLGRIGNWNQCLDLFCKSEYEIIKILFAGDELLPNCIEEIENAFLIDEQIGAVAYPYNFVDLDGNISVSKHNVCGLISNYEINRINYEEGGLLGAIVCNAYKKEYVGNFRFNPMFVGKLDFDFNVLSESKAYYIPKVLASFHLDAHRTFKKALDYFVEAEWLFTKAHWLEKKKALFSGKKYYQIRERIFIDYFLRNEEYFHLITFFKLFFHLTLLLFFRKPLKEFKLFIRHYRINK